MFSSDEPQHYGSIRDYISTFTITEPKILNSTANLCKKKAQIMPLNEQLPPYSYQTEFRYNHIMVDTKANYTSQLYIMTKLITRF
jgi:hypothetical protein